MNDTETDLKSGTPLTQAGSLDVLARDLASSIARRPVVPPLARTVLEQLKDYRKNPENRNAQRPRIIKNIDRIIGR